MDAHFKSQQRLIEEKLDQWSHESDSDSRDNLSYQVAALLFQQVSLIGSPSLVHAREPGEPTDVVTLRDRFAMAALTGLCARSGSNLTPPERTWLAFEYADAAIEAREPKDGAQ